MKLFLTILFGLTSSLKLYGQSFPKHFMGHNDILTQWSRSFLRYNQELKRNSVLMNNGRCKLFNVKTQNRRLNICIHHRSYGIATRYFSNNNLSMQLNQYCSNKEIKLHPLLYDRLKKCPSYQLQFEISGKWVILSFSKKKNRKVTTIRFQNIILRLETRRLKTHTIRSYSFSNDYIQARFLIRLYKNKEIQYFSSNGMEITPANFASLHNFQFANIVNFVGPSLIGMMIQKFSWPKLNI